MIFLHLLSLIITTSNGDEYSYEASWGNNSQFVPILNVNWIDFKSVNSKIHLLKGFDVYSSGSPCIPVIEGCQILTILNILDSANTDDGSCMKKIINGCMDSIKFNYDSLSKYR